MKAKRTQNLFTFTSSLNVLSFLAGASGQELLGTDIQKVVGLSRAGVYLSAKELAKAGLITIHTKGKIRLYSFNQSNPVSRQYKVLLNLTLLMPLVTKLKDVSKKTVLYGSVSRGEDDQSSDIDLFILSHDPEAVKNIIINTKTDFKRKIQAVIKTPVEYSAFKDKEKVYAAEVNSGIVLWEDNK